MYRCLQFVESPSDATFWRDVKSNPDSEDAAEKVAAAIRSAAAVATGGTSAPALLSYLDAEDMGVYVLNLMAKKEAKNKADFFKEMNANIDTKTETKTDIKTDTTTDHSTHADDVDLEACWKKLPPLVRFGKHDHECKASDPAYFESLPLWEQRWVDKSTSPNGIGNACLASAITRFGANQGDGEHNTAFWKSRSRIQHRFRDCRKDNILI